MSAPEEAYHPSSFHPGQNHRTHLSFALAWLPQATRADMMVFYHFCRTIDDIADSPTLDRETKNALLAEWQACLETPENLPTALRDIVQRHHIPLPLLREIWQGCASDVEPPIFQSLKALENYCWQVAGAVGLVSVKIFGCQSPASERHAEHLGLALQLTNILRDVAEDSRMGRIYLPDEILQKHEVPRESLWKGHPTGHWREAMNELADRAEFHYQQAWLAIPPEDLKRLRASRIMSNLYHHILQKMRKEGFPVFEKCYRLTKGEKLWIALRSQLFW